MMRYIINNSITYHEDSSELGSLYDDAAPLPLTNTQNRLLSLLVRNHDIMLSRDTLLEQVWQSHGQIASGSNLNNGISTLRKLFCALGAEDVIVTLPRQGFMFTATELIFEEEQVVEGQSQHLAELLQPKRKRLFAHWKKLCLVFLVLMAVAVWGWVYVSPGYSQPRYVSVGKIGNCDVRFIMSYHKVDSSEIDLKRLQDLLTKNNIQCSHPAMVFYYDNRVLIPSAKRGVRVSSFYYCPTPKNATGAGAIQCENIYESWNK
ncbi:winged helix-turn-helix domain-containing protein [Serratia nevei]|uniref:winged helix-turn-helix domain-containing protein n=1 Tax=Serratia nevei TaxID=2703794 RepID=UPI003FA6A409